MNRNKEKHQSHEEPEKVRQNMEHPGKPAAKSTAVKDASSAALDAEKTPTADPLAEQAATIEKLQDQLLRLRADFDNFRKRTLREKNEIYDIAASELMLELLPVIDHLQLGIQAAVAHQADKAIQDGLQLIFDQWMGVLMKFGLVPFDAEKLPFDPARFEAVSRMASDTEPEGIILAQTRRGYMLRNKLLRPAQVVVSSGPPVEKPEIEKGPDASPSGAPPAAEEE